MRRGALGSREDDDVWRRCGQLGERRGRATPRVRGRRCAGRSRRRAGRPPGRDRRRRSATAGCAAAAGAVQDTSRSMRTIISALSWRSPTSLARPVRVAATRRASSEPRTQNLLRAGEVRGTGSRPGQPGCSVKSARVTDSPTRPCDRFTCLSAAADIPESKCSRHGLPPFPSTSADADSHCVQRLRPGPDRGRAGGLRHADGPPAARQRAGGDHPAGRHQQRRGA